jgi:hypothetical protein
MYMDQLLLLLTLISAKPYPSMISTDPGAFTRIAGGTVIFTLSCIGAFTVMGVFESEAWLIPDAADRRPKDTAHMNMCFLQRNVVMSTLFGNPAALASECCRPVALRPCLSAGLPFIGKVSMKIVDRGKLEVNGNFAIYGN